MPTKKEQNSAIAIIGEIEEKIYVIRGQRVMLDSDLAEVYQVETKALKRAVRRNRHRFPEDFLFELSLDETRHLESLRYQFGTLDESNRGKYTPSRSLDRRRPRRKRRGGEAVAAWEREPRERG